jgi:hypothetical protein
MEEADRIRDAITPDALVGLLERLEPGMTELRCHIGYAEELDDWYRMGA